MTLHHWTRHWRDVVAAVWHGSLNKFLTPRDAPFDSPTLMSTSCLNAEGSSRRARGGIAATAFPSRRQQEAEFVNQGILATLYWPPNGTRQVRFPIFIFLNSLPVLVQGGFRENFVGQRDSTGMYLCGWFQRIEYKGCVCGGGISVRESFGRNNTPGREARPRSALVDPTSRFMGGPNIF